MTITIPVWLLWTLGVIVVVPLLVFIGALALVGWEISKINFRGWR